MLRSWGPFLLPLVVTLAVLCTVTLWTTGMGDQQSTDLVELEALFEVMTSLNSDTDWRAELPDPCSGSQQGIYCLADDISGMFHVTNLEFGFVSDYDSLVICSSNATLHPAIAQLQFLETLLIYNCFTNGSATLPSEIGRLSKSLQMLTLQGNPSLGGALPAEIGNLASLQRLVLTENSFEGVIPDEFGHLSSLLELEMSDNQLNGSIPGSLNALRSLVILDLSWNALSGDMPSLDGLTGLQQLVVNNNNLSGTIPEDFGSLSSLKYLDLSGNDLSGGIPSSFENLTKLQDMFLEGNDMQSHLPEVFGGMPGLLRLSLAGSGFLGEIPLSLGGLVNLRVLLLQGNNFSGPIPLTLGGLVSIYHLDLSANNLTGPVPFSLEFVKKMGSNLVLSNNLGLCIPPANARQAMATLGVSICDDYSELGDLDSETYSPSYPPGFGELQLSSASKRLQRTCSYLFAFSALALWMAFKVQVVARHCFFSDSATFHRQGVL